jgi:hypothetical protein
MARKRARLHRLVNIGDGSFHQMEGAIGRAISARHKQKSQYECSSFYVHEY